MKSLGQFGSEGRAPSVIVCAISAVQGGHDGKDYCPSREQFPGMKDGTEPFLFCRLRETGLGGYRNGTRDRN